jgi:hypothetical protein
MTDQLTDNPAAPAAAPEVTATAPQNVEQPATEPAEPAQQPAEVKPAEAKPAEEKKVEEKKVEEKKPAEKKPEAKKPASAEKKAETVLEAESEEEIPAPATFPDDWREQLAGDNDKLLSRLKRFSSPKTFAESYLALQQKLSSGEYLKALPEDASEEEVAAWRKENGIPTTPEEYAISLGEGLVVGEDDKPLVGRFLERMHKANAKPEHVNAALATYYQIVQEQADELTARNEQAREETQDSLRAEWGNDYRRNVNMVSALLDTYGEEAKNAIMTARAADGTALMNNPSVLRALAQNAMEVNPAATVVPGSGAGAMNSINEEIKSLENRMREDWTGYFKDPAAQARYGELITAREKLASRG